MDSGIKNVINLIITLTPHVLKTKNDTCNHHTSDLQEEVMGFHVLSFITAIFLLIFVFFAGNRLKVCIKFSGLIFVICICKITMNNITYFNINPMIRYVFMCHVWCEIVKHFVRLHKKPSPWFDLISIAIPVYMILMNHKVPSDSISITHGNLCGLIIPDILLSVTDHICNMVFLYTQSEVSNL